MRRFAATGDRGNVLQIAELVFGEFRLLEDGTKGSGGNIFSVHRQIGLPPVLVTQYEMGSTLLTFFETCALYFVATSSYRVDVALERGIGSSF